MSAVILFMLGIGIILWSAERLTDGILGAADRLAVSVFFIAILVSGFEPENLVTGVVANLEGFPQLALGTVIGSGIFMLLGGLGAALLIVPMEVRIPRSAVWGLGASLVPFAWAVFNDGQVSRWEA